MKTINITIFKYFIFEGIIFKVFSKLSLIYIIFKNQIKETQKIIKNIIKRRKNNGIYIT